VLPYFVLQTQDERQHQIDEWQAARQIGTAGFAEV
jgi:hypothetical protein